MPAGGRPPPRWLPGALGWAIAAATIPAAVVAVILEGLAWWPGYPIHLTAVSGPVWFVALPLALAGGAFGLVVGAVTGAIRAIYRRETRVLTLACLGGWVGIGAGGLSPYLALAVEGMLPESLGAVLGLSVAGFFAGLIGYRLRPQPVAVLELEEDVEAAAPDRPRGVPRPTPPPLLPDAALPVVGVSFACLVGVVVRPPSDAGWAVLAVALLGLAVTWALYRQHRRVRELERRLRRVQRRLRRR